MKDILINHPKIIRDLKFANKLEIYLRNKFKKSALWIKGVDVFSNIEYNIAGRPANSKHNNISRFFLQYILFLSDYVNLVLFNNELAEQRKSGPYDIFFSVTLDVEENKAKIHIYLDEDIFGLIAGTKYMNLINIIRASFPIFSKVGFEVELKLFPLLMEKQNKKSFVKKRVFNLSSLEEECDSFSEEDV